jgi:hypothetical protein
MVWNSDYGPNFSIRKKQFYHLNSGISRDWDLCCKNVWHSKVKCPLSKSKSRPLKWSKFGQFMRGICYLWACYSNPVYSADYQTNNCNSIQILQALSFTLPDDDMQKLDSLHRDLRIINLENFPKTLEKDLPDGYKISQYPSEFPILENH